MFARFSKFALTMALVSTPLTTAQFGIAGNRKKPSSFQDLQEMAKQQQDQQAAGRGRGAGGAGAGAAGAGGLAGMNMEDLMASMGGGGGGADLAKMLEETLNDPETKKMYEQLGDSFTQALDQLTKMSPEDLEKQMSEAFQLMSDGPMVDQVVQNRDDVLKQLEASGTVPPEELAKMKANPEYFELKMRESFDQMKDLMSDPNMQKVMSETFSGMKEMFEAGGDLVDNMAQLLGSGELTDPVKIEEARLQLLSGAMGDGGADSSNNPFLKEMLANEEMQALLKDPVKFRESVLEGQEKFDTATNKMAAGGAAIGEL